MSNSYIQAYIHTYIHTQIHTNIHTYLHTYIHTYACMYVSMHTLCMFVHVCIHVCMHVCMRTCMYVCTIFLECNMWEVEIGRDKPSAWGQRRVAWPQGDETTCACRNSLSSFIQEVGKRLHLSMMLECCSICHFFMVRPPGFPEQHAGGVTGVHWVRSVVCVLPLLASAVCSVPFSFLNFFFTFMFHISYRSGSVCFLSPLHGSKWPHSFQPINTVGLFLLLDHFSFYLDIIPSSWRWRQLFPLKCRSESTNLQSIRSQNYHFRE